MTPKTQKTPSSLTDEQRLLLLQSMAHFIQQIGLSKTLKKLLIEASIQKDSLESCSLDMVDMYYQYLKMCDDVKEAISKQDAEGKGPTSEITKEDGGNEGKKSDVVIEKEDVDSGKSKSKKKKKSKTGDASSEQVPVETQSKASNTEEASLSVPSEPAKKPKEKKKKHKGESEHMDGAVQENQSEVATKAPQKADDEKKENKKKKDKVKSNKVKEDPISSSNGATEAEKEKKGSKKRKLSSEEDGAGHDEEAVVNDSKRIKTDNSDQSNGVVQPPKTPEVSANGVLENGGNQSQKQGKTTEPNGSAEPKVVNAFRRVKPEEVEYLDERLQDNSYWAKDGADSGYGAKAQEVLGQVKGRGFRHEKTKKKRGSYRGGEIDLQTHSVKFNYDDDE